MLTNDNAATLSDAQVWSAKSEALSAALRPIFEPLTRKLPNHGCAMLCSPDGMNLCAIGLKPEQLGKLGALTSSLVAIAEATTKAVTIEEPRELAELTLLAGAATSVCIKVPFRKAHLLLIVSAEATPLGVVLTVARVTAEQITKLFSAQVGSASAASS